MSEAHDVTVICDSDKLHLIDDIDARFLFVNIERQIIPVRDLKALLRLIAIFRRERFDIVHSIMPKAGLLAMMAAWCCRVPVRIHTFSGQVWATRTGLFRKLLIAMDAMIARCSTLVLVDSATQRELLIDVGVARPERSMVLGEGSICGIDMARFRPDAGARDKVRRELDIPDEAVVILFAGRLNRDKGIADLAAAFCLVAPARPTAHLLIVAAEEEISFAQVRELCAAAGDRVRLVPFSTTPERYMAAADIYCLPSYREGMPMSVLETAACGIPSIVSEIYGTRDAVVAGVTGLFFPVGNAARLAEALDRLIEPADRRLAMGAAARSRIQRSFSSEGFHRALADLYRHLLRGEPVRYLNQQRKEGSS